MDKKVKGIFCLIDDNGRITIVYDCGSALSPLYSDEQKITLLEDAAGFNNTLKNEEIYLHEYRDEESLYRAVEHFAYTIYNHVRPHSYNGYRTPFEARYST